MDVTISAAFTTISDPGIILEEDGKPLTIGLSSSWTGNFGDFPISLKYNKILVMNIPFSSST